MTSPRELITLATEKLSAAGIESARVDAELLLLHALGITKTQLILLDDVAAEAEANYNKLLNARAARTPLQHLTGRAAFRYLEVGVGPGVLTPRPETELLVDATIAHLKTLRAADPNREFTIVDLCSGSGALTISLAIELAPARVIGLELEPDAFSWGEKNVLEHAFHVRAAGSRIEMLQGDVVGCEVRELAEFVGSVDVVVSNPPYIPTWAVPRDPEVAEHEPAAALYGGEDGMQFVGAVIASAHALLKTGGMVAIEHGDAQGEDGVVSVPRTLRAHGGFAQVRDHLDLAGRPRYSTGVRK